LAKERKGQRLKAFPAQDWAKCTRQHPGGTPHGQYSGGVPRVKGKAINRSGTVAKCRLRPQQGTGGFFICLRSLEVAEQEEIL